MTKRVLVAGGAGFLGTHLSRAFFEKGYNVTIIDNLSTGFFENITYLCSSPLCTFIKADITEFSSTSPFDIIVNLACPASPMWYQKMSTETLLSSVVGTWKLLEIAKRHGSLFVFASTSEVYGSPLEHPQKETYWGNVHPYGPRSCYDEGKRAAESLVFTYHSRYGFPIKILRIFNTYGPFMRADDGRVVSSFITRALAGQSLMVHGTGKQTRSFCYVDDMIKAFLAACETKPEFTGPYNVGNPEEVTIYFLAKLILDLTGSSSKIVFKKEPTHDPVRRCPDISLAKEILRWFPSIPLKEGLLKTIEYFRHQPKSTSNVTASAFL